MMGSSPADALALVTRLAQALDADDFSAARACLAEDCVYVGLHDTCHGSEAIIASYADASAWAHRAFDEVRYASEVGPASAATVSVVFIDYLLKAGGRWHRYRCRQEFTVEGGSIVRITHHELPGEREGLEAYFKECGVER